MYWSRGLVCFLIKQMLHFFFRAHSPGWHEQTPGTPACCHWHLGWEPALTRRALPEPSQQAGEKSFQQLLSPHKILSANCRRTWETLQVLGTLNLFYSPTKTTLGLQQMFHFGSSTIPSLCVTGNVQVVMWDRRISLSFLFLSIISGGTHPPHHPAHGF